MCQSRKSSRAPSRFGGKPWRSESPAVNWPRQGRRTNPENLTGSAIEGGTSRKLAKGDWVMLPEKTPHWFTQVEGALVLMSIHLPRE